MAFTARDPKSMKARFDEHGLSYEHVRPMNGGMAQRSTSGLTSSRGLLILNTYSAALYVPFKPVMDSMLDVSSAGAAA
jgi:hypothetical protein